MKKALFCALLLSVLLFSCQYKKSQITIDGSFKNGGNEMIWLACITSDDVIMLDSVKMNDGNFSFDIKAESEHEKSRVQTPMMYQIISKSGIALTTLAQGGDHISFTGDAKDLFSTYHVQGCEEALLMWQLDSALSSFIKPTEALYQTYQENLEDDSVRAEVESNYVKLLANHKQYLTQFIKNHPNNIASYVAFYQGYNRRTFFTEDADYEMLKTLTLSLQKVYPENQYVKSMTQRLEVLEQMQKQ